MKKQGALYMAAIIAFHVVGIAAAIVAFRRLKSH